MPSNESIQRDKYGGWRSDGRRKWISPEAKAGRALALAAALGVMLENIDVLRPYYDLFLGAPLTVSAGKNGISKPLLLWINDGLMADPFL